MTRPASEVAGALRGVLDDLAAALVSGSTAALRDIELRLSTAVDDLSTITSVAPADRDAFRAELQRLAFALDRCRAIGGGLTSVLDGWLAALGYTRTYDKHGALPAFARAGGRAASGVRI